MNNIHRVAVTDIEQALFDAKHYSRFKFGDDTYAREYGEQLAAAIYTRHKAQLIAKGAVVIPSPYNYVPNAATTMCKHFVRKLNHFLVGANGQHVDYSIIHRKVSYINDYGYLDAATRKSLIDNDEFYFVKEYYKDRIIIFIDDVCISGTHERKLIELMAEADVNNTTIFGYYGTYSGEDPTIESRINFAAIRNSRDFIELVRECKDYNIIVRPLKYILEHFTEADIHDLFAVLTPSQQRDVYAGCLGEGYYKIPKYQKNFNLLKKKLNS